MIKITYLEHSGFAVECDDYVLIFDYYKGNLPQFDKDKKICVFASHVHYDHFKKKIFTYHYPDHHIDTDYRTINTFPHIR